MTDATRELASRWKRLGGALLDSLVAMAVTVPVMMAAGVFGQLAQGQRVFFFFFGLAVFLLINGYLLAKHGQTIGKKRVGTRIVRNADEDVLSRSCLRYVPLSVITHIPILGNLFALVDVLFIFKRDKRCIHDLIAGTKVINA